MSHLGGNRTKIFITLRLASSTGRSRWRSVSSKQLLWNHAIRPSKTANDRNLTWLSAINQSNNIFPECGNIVEKIKNAHQIIAVARAHFDFGNVLTIFYDRLEIMARP